MNAIAAELGSGLSIVNDYIGLGYYITENIESSIFTQGVESIRYLVPSSISVTGNGQLLVRTEGESGAPFIGAEQIEAGLFVLTGDTNVFSDSNNRIAYDQTDNAQLVYNLCSGDLPPNLWVSGVTDGASYEFGTVPTATCQVAHTQEPKTTPCPEAFGKRIPAA